MQDRELSNTEIGDHFEPWEPESSLLNLSLEEVRLSRGFLTADMLRWCPKLNEYWAPLFHTIGVAPRLVGLEASLDFPRGLYRIVPVEVDEDVILVGMDRDSAENISDIIVPGLTDAVRQVVLEYLERRLVYSLSKSWEDGNQSWRYLPNEDVETLEVTGSVKVDLELGGRRVSVWFGLGPELVDNMDVKWRALMRGSSNAHFDNIDVGDLNTVSFEIASLDVSPAVLIDYLRVGSVIDLDWPAEPKVLIRVNREPWAMGDLVQSGGRFATRFVSFNSAEEPRAESTTRVHVELCSIGLDRQTLAEHAQVGAILLTSSRVMAEASLIISGEDVASTIIGVKDGKWSLNVLPKWSR